MHRILGLILLSALPAYAEPYCALPAPIVMAASGPQPRAVDAPPLPSPSPPAVTRTPSAAIPEPLAALPFVKLEIAAGATVSYLGSAHGLHTIGARQGDAFMIFQVTPEGDAAVSGAMTDLTPTQLSTLAGSNFSELGIEHGLRGFFVRSGPQFQVFYSTPDGERVIPGVLYDATGKDITRQQVSNIPGAIPTVTVAGGQTNQPAGQGVPALSLMEKAAFGTIGSPDAPHLWMMIDPQCIYSVRAYQALQPYVASGRLQLSIIPLSVLDHEDAGQSTRSALALLSKPADQMAIAWQAGNVGGQPSPDAAERLRGNMAIAQAIRLTGTPTLIWRKADGTEGRVDGMPSSVEALLSSFGG